MTTVFNTVATLNLEERLEGTTTASLIWVQSDYPFMYTKERGSTVYPLIVFHLPRLMTDEQSLLEGWWFEQTHAFRECYGRNRQAIFEHVYLPCLWVYTSFILAKVFCIGHAKTFIKSTYCIFTDICLFKTATIFSFIFPIDFVSKNGLIKSNITKCSGGFRCCLFAVVFVRFEVHA